MLFTLKKVIGNMLLPLPLMLLIIGAGLALLWFSRFQKTGKIFISIGWLALLLLSLQPVADRLLRPIESTYPTWNNSQKVDYIVVLGGGYTWNPQWAPSSNLINNSLPRLNEGIRLWRENPGSKLIFTGGVAKTNTVSTAEVGARVAQSLGVPRACRSFFQPQINLRRVAWIIWRKRPFFLFRHSRLHVIKIPGDHVMHQQTMRIVEH